MAKLKAATRNALPASSFAGPDRSYPVEDKAHAAVAKARVAGKSPALKAEVDAKADKVLGEKKGTSGVLPPFGKKGDKRAPMSPASGPIPPAALGSMVKSLKGIGK